MSSCHNWLLLIIVKAIHFLIECCYILYIFSNDHQNKLLQFSFTVCKIIILIPSQVNNSYDSIEWIYISCHNYNFPFFHTTSRAEMYCSQSCLVITDICVQDLNVAAIGYLWVKALWFLLFSGVTCCLWPMATMKYMSWTPCAVFVSQCTDRKSVV